MFDATDTALAATSKHALQRHFDLVAEAGRAYGLEVNMEKTVVMTIGDESGELIGTDGAAIRTTRAASYLGGKVSPDGRATTEVSRRLGEARSAFESLSKVWKHANIPRHKKQLVSEALVVSKLLYSFDTLWLLKADRRKLDAFQLMCLRKIHDIGHAYISRVPNSVVLERAQAPLSLSQQLLAKQLQLFQKVAQQPETSLLRQVAFEPESLECRHWGTNRRRGRPRRQWLSEVRRHAISAAGGSEQLLTLKVVNSPPSVWREAVNVYCKDLGPF